MAIDSYIRNAIASNGYITIDDMMRQTLSLHDVSYYRNTKSIGSKGDFTTAPEISQLFGEMIAVWLYEQWEFLNKPKKFILLELGAGNGTLISDILRTIKLRSECYDALNLFFLEINDFFITAQKEKITKFDDNLRSKSYWFKEINQIYDYLNEQNIEYPVILIANEFFDTLPIKQYFNVKNKWYERVLTIDPKTQLIKYDVNAISKKLDKQFTLDHSNANDGAVIEESVMSFKIIRSVASYISKFLGSALVIDYGYDIDKAKRKSSQYNSTLQAIKNHQYVSLIENLGEADVTVHVDFDGLKNAVYEIDNLNSNILSQRDFLIKYGILIRLNILKTQISSEDFNIISKQVNYLIDNQNMGSLFKVFNFVKYNHLV